MYKDLKREEIDIMTRKSSVSYLGTYFCEVDDIDGKTAKRDDCSLKYPIFSERSMVAVQKASIGTSNTCSEIRGCLDPMTKIEEVSYRGIAWDVRILIKK
jgi:hypothetical protein